jgi:hypothetical protein
LKPIQEIVKVSVDLASFLNKKLNRPSSLLIIPLLLKIIVAKGTGSFEIESTILELIT